MFSEFYSLCDLVSFQAHQDDDAVPLGNNYMKSLQKLAENSRCEYKKTELSLFGMLFYFYTTV